MVFTVIDIETTGLSKNYHKITEIAAARVRNGKVVKTHHTLVNPRVKIPSFITRLTGIDNRMVRDAPTIDEVLPSFLRFLGSDVFVAHNATFDFRFIDHNLRLHNGYHLANERLCTRKLANRLYPELSRKRLCDICGFLDIRNPDEHRALGDVQATVHVFNSMLRLLNSNGITSVEDIFKFERSPVRKLVISRKKSPRGQT